MSVKVTIWNEFLGERMHEKAKTMYPGGIHNAIKEGLADTEFEMRTATLGEPEHGLTDEVLNDTEVLVWWGHAGHHLVSDAVVDKVHKRVLKGMGLVVLHSGHESKVMQRLLGTTCSVRWTHDPTRERIFAVAKHHPITEGIPEYFDLEQEELYCEPFGIPNPDEVIFQGWYSSGAIFRSGVTFYRGNGKIFYFQPGHEEFPTYKNPIVLKVIENGIKWAKPTKFVDNIYSEFIKLSPTEVPTVTPLDFSMFRGQ